ncbi:MAG: hypothetical protein WD076_03695 [Parvularculaceae bacterium]
MPNSIAAAAAVLIVAAILMATGAWRALKAAGIALQLIVGLLVFAPYWAIRRRLFRGDDLLRRRIAAARFIA